MKLKTCRVILVVCLFFVTTAAVNAQYKLTAKVGVEFTFIELSHMSIQTNRGPFTMAFGAGLGYFNTVHFGCRVGNDYLSEFGVGLALGHYKFEYLKHSQPRLKANRKLLYLARWFEMNLPIQVGVGAQFNFYHLDFKREEIDPSNLEQSIEVASSWKGIGMDWRGMLRGSFGKTNAHEVMGYLAIGIDRLGYDTGSIDGEELEFTTYPKEWPMTYRLGLSYGYTFGRKEKE